MVPTFAHGRKVIVPNVMKRMLSVVVVVLVVLAGSFVYLMTTLKTKAVETEPTMLPTAMIRVGDRQMIVELAQDPLSRQRGLSYRESLPEDRGMLFVFGTPETQRFWMYQMHFPLDMVFINGDTVVDIAADVPEPSGGIPATVTSKAKADKVLEINAGKATEWGLKVGDKMALF